MSTTTTAVAKAAAPVKTSEEKGLTVYIPFGSNDELKLSVAIIQNYIAVPTKTGKTASEKDCVRFIAMCKARRLNPFEGDAFLIGFDSRDAPGGAKFNLITAHQAFLKRAERNQQYDGMKSGVIVIRDGGSEEFLIGDYCPRGVELVGGWAIVSFKNRSVPMEKRLNLSRFQKQFGVWQEDPAGMICKCAEADALRSSFPTMLGGLYTREEMALDEAPKMKEPIFGQNTLPEPMPVEAIGNSKTPIEQIMSLCEQDGIQERSLVDWLGTIGMADEQATKLSELSDENQDALLNDWENFSNKLKAELNKGKK